mgnify:FL=1|jgi:hypothetical protein
MTKDELRDSVIRADAIDWTKDSEYIRLFGDSERIGVEEDNPEVRHPPRPPMSPFGDKPSKD